MLSYRAAVMLKQFPGKGYTGCFALPFPAVVGVGIWNLFMMPAKDRLLFMKEAVGSLTATSECQQTRCPI